MNSKFASMHEYAKRNGYIGSYDEYVALQYSGYARRMQRMEIDPLKYEDWLKFETE